MLHSAYVGTMFMMLDMQPLDGSTLHIFYTGDVLDAGGHPLDMELQVSLTIPSNEARMWLDVLMATTTYAAE